MLNLPRSSGKPGPFFSQLPFILCSIRIRANFGTHEPDIRILSMCKDAPAPLRRSPASKVRPVLLLGCSILRAMVIRASYSSRRLGLALHRRLDRLLAEVNRFTGGKPFVDDVCLVAAELPVWATADLRLTM